MRRHAHRYPGLGAHFFYWVYAWTNLALKYEGLREEDFQLYSVEKDFDVQKLAPVELTEDLKREKQRDGVKVEAQARFTNRALRKLIEARLDADESPAVTTRV